MNVLGVAERRPRRDASRRRRDVKKPAKPKESAFARAVPSPSCLHDAPKGSDRNEVERRRARASSGEGAVTGQRKRRRSASLPFAHVCSGSR